MGGLMMRVIGFIFLVMVLSQQDGQEHVLQGQVALAVYAQTFALSVLCHRWLCGQLHVPTEFPGLDSRQSCSPPATLESRSYDLEDGREDPCCICLEQMVKGNEVSELPCHHVFHRRCLDVWLQQRRACPLRCSTTEFRHDCAAQTGAGAAAEGQGP